MKIERLLKEALIVGLSTLGVAMPANAFTVISNSGKPAYWEDGQVGYYFHSSVESANQNAFRQAFASWANVAGVSLVIQELGTMTTAADADDNLNTISWITSGWRQLSFRPPSNALAVTLLSFNSGSGTLADADIFFNSENFAWGVVGDPGTSGLIDVQNIATHEIGHLLGLDHSSEEYFESEDLLADATMYYASGAGETSRRDLKEDDIYGLRALYGSSSVAAPSVSAVTELGRDEDDIVEFQVIGSEFNELTSFLLTDGSTLESDRIARYRTIVSPTEARITLDLNGFPNGGAELVVFNNATAVATYGMTVESSGISATSGGGGGGCSVQARTQGEFSWVTFYFVMLSSLSLLLARRRFRRTPRAVQPEEGL